MHHLTPLLRLAMLGLLTLGQSAEPPGENPAPESDLSRTYEEGVRAVEEANWALALERFQQVLEADADHVASRFYLAVALDETGDTDEAIAQYERVLAQDASVVEARLNLGAVLAETGRLDEAVIQFGEAMEQTPNDPRTAMYYAQLLDQLERSDEAIGAYQRVIEISPNGAIAAEAYRNLGSLYISDGADRAAYDALRQAVTQGINEAAIHAALGDLALRIDRVPTTAALEHYERALAIDPGNPEIRLRRGLLLAESGRSEEALEILEGISASDVSISENDLDRVIGTVHLDLERYDEAAVVWSRLAERAPDVADHWTQLGVAYRESGRPEDAIPALERALDLAPDDTQALGTLASIRHQSAEWLEAIDLFERYVELRPTDATARHSLAVAYDELQNYPQALLNYNRFLAIDDGTNDARRFQTERRVESLEQLLENN